MKKLIYILVLPILMGAMACVHLTSSTSKQATIVDQLKRGEDVNMKNRTIAQDLDLNQVWKVDQRSIRIGSALFFQNCTFEGNILAQNRTGGRWVWEGDVIFENCHFQGDFKMTDAVFDGRVRIINCTFSKSLDLQRSTFMNAVRVTGNQAGNDIILQYGRFYHDLQAKDNQPGRFILAQGISVHGHLQISGTKAQGVDLGQGHFHEDVSANYLEVADKINLTGSLCLGDFSIRDTKVESTLNSQALVVRGQLDIDPDFKK